MSRGLDGIDKLVGSQQSLLGGVARNSQLPYMQRDLEYPQNIKNDWVSVESTILREALVTARTRVYVVHLFVVAGYAIAIYSRSQSFVLS